MNICMLLLTISLTSIPQSSTYNIYRRKRSNTENFNVLLSIYKMNPLKRSNVFKTFSNRVLLPRPDEQIPDLNYNSNESTKKKNGTNVKLKPIDAIHYAPRQTVIDEHLYVDNKPEKFDPGHFFNNLLSINESEINKKDDDMEILINKINNYKKLDSDSSLNPIKSKTYEKNNHLKVYDLNKVESNLIDFDDADVLVVK